ncbi:GntR family transcriptional regulator [Xanthobacter tagetidis]|jgi:DNA-binding GntR family transcriptional regulator|uniref:GntR family transcriptional regulator n=1 Tax=Xanthobacter tagetidis TaxID=60216 RepID=A0A3L7AH55_9HYPH|nr:GntR family transcriptional regulator [Xanthobacter tagetidis]MBB6306701.1 DNA-binding GntR family transcriptional regulator [Xanthobacter tagetidis]RLP78991.1 GntR family transcriptional regulator [Xanthobacter tagetidis]
MDPNLREQVLRQVRSEIISGQSGPGKMYSVPTLAADLGMSTTPVREALLELARTGLIEPMRNRGFKVVEPTVDDLRNLFDMRSLLEVHAAELFALKPRKKKKLIEQLTGHADAIRAAVENDDLYGYLENDRNFHMAFIGAAENALLTEMAMGLRDKMRLHGISSRAGLERQAASVDEHYQLTALAEAGNVDGIRELMRNHILTWEPIFMEALLKSRRETSGTRA